MSEELPKYRKIINRDGFNYGVFIVKTEEWQETSPGEFQYVQIASLELDFNPIIAALSEREKLYNYRLLHWQALPKGDREWGIFDPVNNSYVCSVFEDHVTAYGAVKMIMLDDETANTIPSAVIYFVGSLPVYGDRNLTEVTVPFVPGRR